MTYLFVLELSFVLINCFKLSTGVSPRVKSCILMNPNVGRGPEVNQTEVLSCHRPVFYKTALERKKKSLYQICLPNKKHVLQVESSFQSKKRHCRADLREGLTFGKAVGKYL